MTDNVAVGSTYLHIVSEGASEENLDKDLVSFVEDCECPECRCVALIVEGHCITCSACGWSLCTN